MPLTRFLARLGKTGDLRVACDGWQGRICLDHGRLITAVAANEVAWSALELVLLGTATAHFEFTAGPPSLAPNLEAKDDDEVWARLAQLATPCQVTALAVPGPTTVPGWTRLSEQAEEGEVTLSRASLAVLLAVDGRSDVSAIAAKHGWIRTLKGLVQLRQLDLIAFDRSTAEDAHHPPAPPEDTISQQVSTDAALSGRSATRRVRPKRRTHLVLAGWVTGLSALLALLWLSGPVGNRVMFVKGSSMTPLLRPGQLLVLNGGAYRVPDRAGPRRGDVVIFRRGAAADEDYLVKRVIGLPGDLVLIDAGRVFVNGTQLDEPYVLASDDYTYPLQGGPVRVPDGAYFVLGDNRPESADSHLGWFVAAGDVVGQAWPLPVAFPSLADAQRCRAHDTLIVKK